jgi:hypothetical protein
MHRRGVFNVKSILSSITNVIHVVKAKMSQSIRKVVPKYHGVSEVLVAP